MRGRPTDAELATVILMQEDDIRRLEERLERAESEIRKVKGQKALQILAVNEQGQRLARVRELRDRWAEGAAPNFARALTEALDGDDQ